MYASLQLRDGVVETGHEVDGPGAPPPDERGRSRRSVLLLTVVATGVANLEVAVASFAVLRLDHGSLPGALLVAPVAALAVAWALLEKAASPARSAAIYAGFALAVGPLLGALSDLATGHGLGPSLGRGLELGPAICLGATPLLWAGHRACRARSREALAGALLRVGGGLAATGALSGLGTLLTVAESVSGVGVAVAVLLFVGLPGGLGLALVSIGFAHRKARRSWLERVAHGEVAGWAVVPASRIVVDPDALPPLIGDERGRKAVLVRRREGAERGAYRTGETLEPYALVERPAPGRGRAPRAPTT